MNEWNTPFDQLSQKPNPAVDNRCQAWYSRRDLASREVRYSDNWASLSQKWRLPRGINGRCTSFYDVALGAV